MLYELAHLGVPARHHQEASAAVAGYCAEQGGRGHLLGCWSSEIGDLNRMAVLRRFEDASDLARERQSILLATDPFRCGAFLTSLSLEAYVPFPGLHPVRPGAYGPVYEIRTYDLRIGGLQQMLDAWARALPGRTELSRLLIAMYALDGAPRFTHVWPYRSLEERSRTRQEAASRGLWPPNAFPGSTPPPMRTAIYLPLPCSPLR